MTGSDQARELLRAAYENRYTWDANFPGYHADVILTHGAECHRAKVRLGPDLKFAVTEASDPAAAEQIRNQMWEIAVHRVRRPFEETHAQNIFSLGETDQTGAVEILVGGKGAGDRYKVRDREVCMVHRHIHGVVVTIHTFSSHHTPEGYLSHRYDSVYHDPQTGAQKGERSEFTDLFTQVGGYYILTQRTIRTETQLTQFSFENVEVLEPVPV